MNIWTIKANEPMPVVNNEQRLLRVGMLNKKLIERGHNVIWFSSSFDHFNKKQLYKNDTIINVDKNYKLYILWAPKYKKNISFARVLNHKILSNKLRKKMKLLKKPDLIYVSFPLIQFAEEAIKYGRKNNVPVIVDIRDLWPDIFKHNLSGIVKFLAIPYIMLMDHKTKKIMKSAYAINSISQAMLEWGFKKGKREKNNVDRYFYIGYYKQEDNNGKIDIRIDESKFNICFFATINNQFDYDKLIKLAEYLEKKDNNIIFNICGDGPQFSKLKENIKNINNVKLFGWTDKNSLSYILKKSKLGFAPYKNTFDFQMSVSNKFSEYISYGLPVILTSGGYMKELLEKNQCGFSTQNMEEMAKFIIELKNNSKIYKQMSDNAFKLYKEEFDAEKIYTNLVDYLESINKEEKL